MQPSADRLLYGDHVAAHAPLVDAERRLGHQTPAEILTQAVKVLRDRVGYAVSETDVDEIIQVEAGLLEEIRDYGLFDTSSVEWLLDGFARYALGYARWPINSDGEEVARRLEDDLARTAERCCWKRI